MRCSGSAGRFQTHSIDSSGVTISNGVALAKFKNIPRVAYRSSIGRKTIFPETAGSTSAATETNTLNNKNQANILTKEKEERTKTKTKTKRRLVLGWLSEN
jgi:hypothetical protein